MKKSNLIALIGTLVISIFLLWLWYFLGLNKVDSPLDLILSVMWWVIVAIVAIATWRTEKQRRQKMRSIYVGESVLFNPQVGQVEYAGPDHLVKRMQEIFDALTYNFTKEDMPDPEEVPFSLIVRTEKYKAAGDEEKAEWEGTVCYRNADGEEAGIAFASREELSRLLAQLEPEKVKQN